MDFSWLVTLAPFVEAGNKHYRPKNYNDDYLSGCEIAWHSTSPFK